MTIGFTRKFPGPSYLCIKGQVVRAFRPEGSRHFRIACRFIHIQSHGAEIEIIRQFVHWMRLQHNPFEGKGFKVA